MAYKDPEDAKASKRKHYANNKAAYVQRTLEAREKIDNYIRDVKSQPCTDCGVQYPHYVMDLDHRDPSQKAFNPSRLSRNGSMRKAVEEVAKCDVVCSNCHRQRTFGSHT